MIHPSVCWGFAKHRMHDPDSPTTAGPSEIDVAAYATGVSVFSRVYHGPSLAGTYCGQHHSLTPDEARKLARLLLAVADDSEALAARKLSEEVA